MRIGLTGGIATGKSTVSEYLREQGAWIVDADAIAHQVVEPGEEGLEQVIAHFGPEILAADGQLDRKRLGALIFADPEQRRVLEQILHPLIRKRMWEETAEGEAKGYRWIVWDVPLLIENGLYKEMDYTILVVVDEETQIARLMARDQLREEEAKRRIAAQLPTAEKRQYADFIIENSGSREATFEQVDQVLAKLELG